MDAENRKRHRADVTFPFSLAARIAVLLIFFANTLATTAAEITLSRSDYRDRVEAVWTAQIVAVIACWPFEHQTASTLWIDRFPKPYTAAPVDDDWYYEMCAVRGFEKHGVTMTAEQLG